MTDGGTDRTDEPEPGERRNSRAAAGPPPAVPSSTARRPPAPPAPPDTSTIPEGDLVRSRVVADLATALEDALDRRLTGYLVLADALTGGNRGVLTVEAGVPVVAYHPGRDRGGPAALAALAAPGPTHVDAHELPAAALAPVHAADDLRVPPGMPADRLAGAPALAARTRRAAPDDADAGDVSAVEAFLEDEAAIESLRTGARAEARRRADEWGFADALE